jgi:TonB-linked SusC/RagA family outer membrane protein
MSSYIFKWCNQYKFFVWSIALHFICLSVTAQIRVQGLVTDKDEKGVAGVSVGIKNTSFGTATDANGAYSVNTTLTPGRYIVEFTGVGFKIQTKRLIVSKDSIYTVNTALGEDIMGLEEVVVTGTTSGTTRRQLGNYISTIKADELSKGVSTNVLQALQGKSAGAQITQNSGDPAGGLSVRLRGISTITGSSDPLYIVDGVILNNSTNRVTNTSANYDGGSFVGSVGQSRMVDINPADIERVEVLNGAAAAAIYGSRANAGVVQIFTKKGSNGAPKISFSSSLMVSSLRKKIDVNQSPVKFGGSPDLFTQDILAPDTTRTTGVSRYNYQDDIFRTGIGTDNTVSVSGGKDKTRYYASAAYFNNQGIVKNTDFKRYSFRVNLDQTINEWASFNIGLNYVNSSANEKPDGNSFYSPINSINIIGNFHDINALDAFGNLKAVGERGRVNPITIIDKVKQRQETNRVLANVGLKLRPFKNATFDYTLGIDNYSQGGTTLIPPYPYNANPAFFGGGAILDATQNGYASSANNTFLQVNNELNFTYKVNITEQITSTTQLGYSLQYEKGRYVLAQGRGIVPGIQTAGSAITAIPSVDDRSELAISGGYLQQNFKFKNNLFVTAALRVDGSTVFGTNQRNQVYSKASAGYVISGTDYWEKLNIDKWFNLFKVRMAYGESGNLTAIGAYDRFNLYTPSPLLTRGTLSSSSTLKNEDFAPERQKELEIGTDLSFFNNRIGVQFNWYQKKVSSLLINRFIAPTTGFSSLTDNIGSLENKGIELVVNANPVKHKDFNWNITAIYNRNRNKIIDVGQGLILLSTNSGAPVSILQGQPVGVFYGTFFAKTANGDQVKTTAGIPTIEKGVQNSPLVYTTQRDVNGLPAGTTLRKVIGNPNPDFTFTFTNEFAYKQLALRIQLDGVQGVDVFNADWRTRQGVGSGKVAEQEQLGKLPRGYIAGVYPIEEWRIDNGSFVKLRELSLSYSLGAKGGFNDMIFSLSGRNLISWDSYKGWDPEVNSGGQSTILRGIDFGSVPIPKTFSIGVQAKF